MRGSWEKIRDSMSIATRSPIKHGYQIAKHFWLYEFECPCLRQKHDPYDGFCNGAVMIAPALLNALDLIRATFGAVTIINGFRCWNYHEELYRRINEGLKRDGKPERVVTQNSPHLTGEAVDLYTKLKLKWPGHEHFLRDAGITGAGHKEGRVTHVDTAHATFKSWGY